MQTSTYSRQRQVTTALLLGAILGVCLIMFLLGWYLVRQYRELQIQNAAEAGGLYVEGFLAPHAHEFTAEGDLSAKSRQDLDAMIKRLPVSGHFDTFKIWDKDGALVFNTDRSAFGEAEKEENETEMRLALQGEIVVTLITEKAKDPHNAIDLPYLEIYAPILNATNNEIVAVGEIYQNASRFLGQRRVIERSIWIAIGASTTGLCGLLLLVMAQRAALLRHLDAIRAIAIQNRNLKNLADQARMRTSQSNEQLLNQLGAELHDGPIQLLSLMMLMGGKNAQERPATPGLSVRELGDRVMNDLRAISSGLILPEVRDHSLEASLRMAVERHESFTGQKVDLAMKNLPAKVDEALKICCYRMVQEGLTNAYRHAGGNGPRVSAETTPTSLVITVSDDGKDTLADEQFEGRRARLGLQGIRNRLEVFGGELEIRRRPGQGTDLVARIPLEQPGIES